MVTFRGRGPGVCRMRVQSQMQVLCCAVQFVPATQLRVVDFAVVYARSRRHSGHTVCSDAKTHAVWPLTFDL
eukprot:2230029-Rhodomonas_salina.1